MKYLNTITLLSLLFFVSTKTYSQQQLKHEKTQYIDSLNRFYMQVSLPLYVFAKTLDENPPTPLSFDDNDKEKNQYKPIYMKGHGIHKIRHSDEHTKQIVDFDVYADGIAPKSTLKLINANIFSTHDKTFYGPNLTAVLSAKDEMSGVKQIYQSVVLKDYSNYLSPIDFKTEGEHTFQYYTVDNVGNVEDANKSVFTVDLKTPKTFYNIIGLSQNKIISTATRVYLTPTDSISGVAKTFYYFDNKPEVLYHGEDLPTANLTEGDHTLSFYSVDNVKNKEAVNSFSFFLDKTAPIMSADVLGDRFIVGNRVYYSGRTKLKLTAVDNKAGVKKVLYSVDNSDFTEYTEPFYLPAKSGQHTVKYFAIDNVENLGTGTKKYSEYKHVVGVVYVDLTGPGLKNQFDGPTFIKGDSVYIAGITKINLSATDGESGLKHLKYIVDNGKEVEYLPPLTVNTFGKHTVTVAGYDNVNNRNARSFEFVVDNIPPEIIVNFSTIPIAKTADANLYPSYVSVYLACIDASTDCGDMLYSINGGVETVYHDKITGFQKNTKYTIKITSTDKLQNKSEKIVNFNTNSY